MWKKETAEGRTDYSIQILDTTLKVRVKGSDVLYLEVKNGHCSRWFFEKDKPAGYKMGDEESHTWPEWSFLSGIQRAQMPLLQDQPDRLKQELVELASMAPEIGESVRACIDSFEKPHF